MFTRDVARGGKVSVISCRATVDNNYGASTATYSMAFGFIACSELSGSSTAYEYRVQESQRVRERDRPTGTEIEIDIDTENNKKKRGKAEERPHKYKRTRAERKALAGAIVTTEACHHLRSCAYALMP